MATIWTDNFENYAVGANTIGSPWLNTSPFGPTIGLSSLISNTIAGGGSTQSLGLGVNGGSAEGAGICIRSFLANLNELTVDFYVYMPSGSTVPDPPQSNAPGLLLENSVSGGYLEFRMGGAGNVLVGQAPTSDWFSFNLSIGAWHHIVWTTTLAASGGASSLTVDGGSPMTFSGNTTTNSGDTTVNQVSLVGQFVVGSPAATIFFDTVTIGSGSSPPANTLIAQAAGPVGLGRWRTSTGINWYGMALVGDAFSGVLGLSDFESFTEYGNPMLFQITTPPIHDDRKRIFMPRFEIEVEAGSGIDGEPTTVPIMSLEWSKDGGVTWSPLKPPQSMGLIGEYIKRLRWLNLGQSRTWIFRLTCTDPTRRYIIGAYTSPYKSLG